MSIKSRLRLSYIAMLIVPIFLSVVVTLIMGTITLRKLGHAYDIKIGKNYMPAFMERVNRDFMDIKQTENQNPDLFKDMNYVKNLDKKLGVMHSGIVVRKDNKLLYSSDFLNNQNIDILNELPRFGAFMEERRNRTWIGDSFFVPRQTDFHFSDNSEGSVFIITDVRLVKETAIKFLVSDITAIVLILILTDFLLTFVVSKSIIDPLESLKNAAVQIKNGNLDFKVKNESYDEVGEVFSAFEEMRSRLKESDILQMQYENNRKELISNISHDLKTPVTAIKGYVEGIMDGVADSPEKMDRYVKTIYSKASDLDRLIEELFLFSKLDLNKVPYNFGKINIKRYLEDSCEELQFDLEEKFIKLTFEPDIDDNDNILMVRADGEKIKRVITNIVNNAAKYMDKDKGLITIKLKDSEKFVEVIIEDNGQGISKKDLPFVFDRFYRADPARSTLTGGSGLGLAIVKLIIEEHGGRIWAESEEGVGTRVHFTLEKINYTGGEMKNE